VLSPVCSTSFMRLSLMKAAHAVTDGPKQQVESRVSHISRKTSEMWGTHCAVAVQAKL
jgi:hypothetical protein